MCRLDHVLTYSCFVSFSLLISLLHACTCIYMLTHIHTLTDIYNYIYIYGLTRSCILILCDTHTVKHTRIHIH